MGHRMKRIQSEKRFDGLTGLQGSQGIWGKRKVSVRAKKVCCKMWRMSCNHIRHSSAHCLNTGLDSLYNGNHFSSLSKSLKYLFFKQSCLDRISVLPAPNPNNQTVQHFLTLNNHGQLHSVSKKIFSISASLQRKAGKHCGLRTETS